MFFWKIRTGINNQEKELSNEASEEGSIDLESSGSERSLPSIKIKRVKECFFQGRWLINSNGIFIIIMHRMCYKSGFRIKKNVRNTNEN